jgi:hypothetical protein
MGAVDRYQPARLPKEALPHEANEVVDLYHITLGTPVFLQGVSSAYPIIQRGLAMRFSMPEWAGVTTK